MCVGFERIASTKKPESESQNMNWKDINRSFIHALPPNTSKVHCRLHVIYSLLLCMTKES